MVWWVGMCLEISSPAENVARFVSFCAANNLAIVLTMFPPKNIHKYTWTAPNERVRDQVDHVAVISKFQRSVRDTRSYTGEDSGSDLTTSALSQLLVFVCAG